MKIAFIHNNAKTGATAHAIMLAKRLQEKMEVVFLRDTTTLVCEQMASPRQPARPASNAPVSSSTTAAIG